MRSPNAADRRPAAVSGPIPAARSRGPRFGATLRPMIVLGIETSCDETAAAVVTDAREIRASLVLSQLEDHRPFGGVVPEIAARAHLDHLDRLVRQALDQAAVGLDALDAIAATGGPGLIGGVIVGVTLGKALALARRLPFVAVN